MPQWQRGVRCGAVVCCHLRCGGGDWERWLGQNMGDSAATPRGVDSLLQVRSHGKVYPGAQGGQICVLGSLPGFSLGCGRRQSRAREEGIRAEGEGDDEKVASRKTYSSETKASKEEHGF